MHVIRLMALIWSVQHGKIYMVQKENFTDGTNAIADEEVFKRIDSLSAKKDCQRIPTSYAIISRFVG